MRFQNNIATRNRRVLIRFFAVLLVCLPSLADASLKVDLQNLMLTTAQATPGPDGLFAFLVIESSQGADLTGDGDQFDVVPHVYDSSTGVLQTIPTSAACCMAFGDGFLALALSEADRGQDLNGDGDQTDLVLHLFRPVDGTLENLGYAVGRLQVSGRRVAFTVPEGAQGQYLNADADMDDDVLHVYDDASATTRNLALDADSLALRGDLLAFYVREAKEGMDLNGDTDEKDFVMHVADLTAPGAPVNLHVAGTGSQLEITGRTVGFAASEVFQGTDLNGDGDKLDAVFHTYDVTRGLTNVGLQINNLWRAGARFAFDVRESGQGSTDLNGDLDALDSVLHVLDPASGAVTNLGLARAVSGGIASASTDRFPFPVSEPDQGGQDLNGDGDSNDEHVLHVYDPSTGAAPVNLGVAGVFPVVVGGSVAMLAVEKEEGDLNGDSDVDDLVAEVVDIATRQRTNIGVAHAPSSAFRVDGDRLFLQISESAQGGSDLNGDGDADDLVLAIYDIGDAALTAFPLAAFGIPLATDVAAVVVYESQQADTDLNGDGDAFDQVLHIGRFSPDPADSLEELIDLVGGLGLPNGIENSLTSKLEGAAAALAAGNLDAAVAKLEAFINEVEAQRGKKIDAATADELIAQARAILDALAAATP